MAAEKKEKLEMAIAALQIRYGLRVIGKGARQREAGLYIPTGFPTLDTALGTGGLPRGRLSQIAGSPTSGMATLALKIVTNVQTLGETAVYLDVDHVFDPDYAARCGLNLDLLLLVQPYSPQQALALLPELLTVGPPGVLVVDIAQETLDRPAVAAQLATVLDRLLAALGRTVCTLIFLTALPLTTKTAPLSLPTSVPLAHYAAVRLLLRQEHWLYRRGDIRGYRAQVILVKNKLAATAGQTVEITITFNGTVAGDAT